MAIASGASTRASARSTSGSRSFVLARTFRRGCSSRAGAPSAHSSPSWPRPMCSGSARAASRTWSRRWALVASPSRRSASSRRPSTARSRPSAADRSMAHRTACCRWMRLALRVREGGRIVSAAALLAIGVNREGRREICGLDVVTAEDGAAWVAFLRDLVARGLSGVALVTSDAHDGLKAAIAACLPGAAWQRCRTHFMRNLLTRDPQSAPPFVATMVLTIFAQPDAASKLRQHGWVVEQLRPRFAVAAGLLEEAREELLAFTSFPRDHWRRLGATNS